VPRGAERLVLATGGITIDCCNIARCAIALRLHRLSSITGTDCMMGFVAQNQNLGGLMIQFGYRCVQAFVEFLHRVGVRSLCSRFEAFGIVCEHVAPSQSNRVQRQIDSGPFVSAWWAPFQ